MNTAKFKNGLNDGISVVVQWLRLHFQYKEHDFDS